MIAPNPNSTCEQARPYYYGYLFGEGEKHLPAEVLAHVSQCSSCQAEVNRLKIVLAESEEHAAQSTRQVNSAVITSLRLHFAYIGVSVTCNTAKPFLPSLADPLLEVGVPTPITVHLDKCQQCANDLETIRRLNLTHKQLCRLGQLFAKKPSEDAISYPTCLGKMQDLHNTVYGILERKESGIVTCFKVDESARDSIVGSPDDVYEDWPIEVQVFDKSSETETIEDRGLGVAVSRKPKQRLSTLSIRPFIKPAAVAAAAILVAILLLNIPVAKAVDLGQIYEALERIKNVCLTAFIPEKAQPTQEIWISQALNIKMFKTETECVLWDLEGKSRKSRDLNTGSITIAELDSSILVKVEETMKMPWGLLPFDDISRVPEDAEWQQVADEDIETTIAETEVYDLIWIEKELIGSIVYKKWRGYIDIETKLPMRVERWRKRANEEEYELLTVTKIAYPTAVEIRAVIEDVGF